jgi:hypothetical protein
MSHAYGQVRFSDGLVLHYRYYGTVDMALDALFDTASGVYDDWRSHTARACVCGKDEPVEIATEYGSGFSWNGRACRHCMAITAGFSPYEKTESGYVVKRDGLPDWWVSGEEEFDITTTVEEQASSFDDLW